MGKTYRKNSWIHKSKAFYVQDEANKDYARLLRRGHKVVRKSKEEYDLEYKEAEEQYLPKLKEYEHRLSKWYINKAVWVSNYGNDRLFYFYYGREPMKPYFYVSKWKDVPIRSKEEEIAEFAKEASDRYDSYFRDRSYEGGMRKAYKNLCKKDRRRKDRKNIHKIMKDADSWDDMDWADNKDGKQFIWSVW